jgi:hypothetical protein
MSVAEHRRLERRQEKAEGRREALRGHETS